jgi:RNA polymerase sigma factor (sigma-70 family)
MADGVPKAMGESGNLAGEEQAGGRGACAPPERPGLEALVAANEERIRRVVYRLLGWSHEAEDVVQEVFLSALKGLGKFRGGSSMTSWLTRIAVNECRSHWRKRVIRLRSLGRQQPPAGELAGQPADGLMDRETFARIRRQVRALPGRYREVVVLRYLEEMSRDQTAEALGISTKAVDVRLHRARVRLKAALADLVEE